jgi:tetratricopeptide (TPR) repeat protein
MYRNISRVKALAGCAFLVLIPNAIAGTLREEAASYRSQGYALQQQGDKAGALAFYQKAATLDASYPTPYNDAGILLEEQDRLEDAKQSYQQALAINPNYVDAHTNLALLYERMGEKDKAIVHWLKRYQLGEWDDPWTARAGERLVALGVLNSDGLKAAPYTRRHIMDQAFEDNAKSLKEFHAVTTEHGDWP